jgi:hypothetical protein
VLATEYTFLADPVGPTQNAVGGNGSSTPGTVRPVRLDGELPLLTRAHVEKTLVPALDDLALAHGEGQWLASVV